MNWYKISQQDDLWDKIKKYGPHGESEELAIKDIMEKMNLSRDEAIKYFNENDFLSDFYRRDAFVKNYGWGTPTKEAIEKIKQFVRNDTILEIGSGSGLWAKLLKDEGLNIIATNKPFEKKEDYKTKFTDVQELNHLRAIQKYGYHNVLMISWPLYDDPMAYESLKDFQGNKLIFIGEEQGGCTGCDNFFDLLNQEWKLYETINLPNWYGIYDSLLLFVRK